MYSYLLSNFKPGEEMHYTPKCYQSTATKQSFAHSWGYSGNVVLKINAKAGTPVAAVSQVLGMHGDGEHEIVLGRDVTYKVNALYKHDGKLYADVDAVYPQAGSEMKKKTVTASKKPFKPVRNQTPGEYVRELTSYSDPDVAEAGMCIVYDSNDKPCSLLDYNKAKK